jgi:hypothetical protein
VALKDEWRILGMGHLSATDPMKETLREGSITRDPEIYAKQGSKMGVCFHRSPAFGEHGGALLRAFLFRGIFVMFSTEMQMPCKRVSLSIGTLLGVRLSGFLTEKKKCISVISWTQRTLRF